MSKPNGWDAWLKNELLENLWRSRDELESVLQELTEDEIIAQGLSGEWTGKDVVGHLTYWEQVILDFVRQTFAEGQPRKLTTEKEDINGREVQKRKHWSWQRVRAEFVNTRRALIERVESLSETELAFQIPSPWWDDDGFITLARLIDGVNIHCREHLTSLADIGRAPTSDEIRAAIP